MARIRIIADDKIPYLKGALDAVADVEYLPGASITRSHLQKADALIVRTRTRCNEELLEGTPVKFIATATIGYDHIDVDYCRERGIVWTNAPGCNSGSVQQYLAAALVFLARKFSMELKGTTLGIVGVGHVGKKVQQVAEIFGMRLLLNDPPRERQEGSDSFVSLAEICRQADIITFHVPLIKGGPDNTFHLAGESFFAGLRKGVIIINSSRGEVVETAALKKALGEAVVKAAVIDVWENEPVIDRQLLSMVTLGTPHIAGYSRDGKAGGTMMSVQAISRFFNLGLDHWQPPGIELPPHPEIFIDPAGKSREQVLQEAVYATYKIEEDDRRLREDVSSFERQREQYPVRREFYAYRVALKNPAAKYIEPLRALGFQIIQ